MDHTLGIYLPQDRRRALAKGETLAERTDGAVLFADISGFTPLTEALTQTLGPRRGPDVLSRQLDAVYDALIAEVDRYGGSVVSFAGDAITCWFEGDGAAGRAAACALALQNAAQQFVALPLPDGATTELALRVVVTSGPARRFVVGDPAIQVLDALAGATVSRVATADELAEPGEVVIDEPTATALGGLGQMGAWRADTATGQRFAVLHGLAAPVEGHAWADSAADELPEDVVRPWLLPALYMRHQAGQGEFLTELRPVVVLFLRFTGIDYEGDADAGGRLDTFIRTVQGVLERYAGTLLQLNIGDKGSYLYAAFGALAAHEDDAHRAVKAALDLHRLTAPLHFPSASSGQALAPVQIGITEGMLRTGAYGGPTRRTYGALGDDVNVAARLMGLAAPGETLISGRVQQALAQDFALEPRPPLRVKGKSEPLPVFAVTGVSQRRAMRLEEPDYALPMVGRAEELARVAQKLEEALHGHGQVVGISAEAGMGKSRLVAEVIRLARRRGMEGYGGACQSYGTNTSYLVWQTIWRALFDIDPGAPLRRQVRALESYIEDVALNRLDALPLLGEMLNLPLPDNDFTRTLQPQHRKATLHALLLDCLRGAAREAAENGSGMLIVLEDLHWIDPLSHDLLERVGQAIVDLPVLILLAYRPPDLERVQAPRVEAMPHFTKITLAELTAADSEQVIRAKLAQLFPERTGAVPPILIERVTTEAQGNPFYVEELVNYLHDRGIDPLDTAALQALELPSSLHSLILSRIDQLTGHQQLTLKVASVIGRRFRFAWLHGYYPPLGPAEPLKADLDELARLELTPLETPEPRLAYLFKHIVTREVTYESLVYATRAALHEQFAAFLEGQTGDETERSLDLLAYHYERSENLPKKLEYLRRAGEAAAARFANTEAIAYLSRALELTPVVDTSACFNLLLAREGVYRLQGDRPAQAQDLEALGNLADDLHDDSLRAEVALHRARYAVTTAAYPAAIGAIQEAMALARTTSDHVREAAAHFQWGWILFVLADYQGARVQLEQAHALAKQARLPGLEANSLAFLGFALGMLGDSTAHSCETEALTLFRTLGDQQGEGFSRLGLGILAMWAGRFVEAEASLTDSLQILRRIEDRLWEVLALLMLGETLQRQGNYDQAQSYFTEALEVSRGIGNKRNEAATLVQQALLGLQQNDLSTAYDRCMEALGLSRMAGLRGQEAAGTLVLDDIRLAQGQSEAAADSFSEAWKFHQDWGPFLKKEALAGLARGALARGDLAQAQAHVEGVLAALEQNATSPPQYEPFRAELTCYQVLRTAGDPRATQLLAQAHARLQEQASGIKDGNRRRVFLDNVPAHRALIRAWMEHMGQAEGS